mgnify:FL=1|jgi:hypothetical protein
MNHRACILLALLALGSSVALLASASPAPVETTQWEYAVYWALGNRCRWQTKDTTISASHWADLCNQLNIKTKVPIDKYTVDTILTNHFGEQGWELIEISPPGPGGGTFWFKRPLR